MTDTWNPPPGAADRSARRPRTVAWQRSGQAVAALMGVLERLIPIARRVVGGVRALAWSGVAATVVIVGALVVVSPPTTPLPVLGLLALAGVLIVPAVVVGLFHGALREVLALPACLRSSPELARSHGGELARLVAESRGATTGARRRGRFVRDLGGAGRLLLETHRDLPGYGAILRLISPTFLIAVAVSAAAILTEWFLAAVMAGSALVLHLIG